jgi:hypothetical protein
MTPKGLTVRELRTLILETIDIWPFNDYSPERLLSFENDCMYKYQEHLGLFLLGYILRYKICCYQETVIPAASLQVNYGLS